MGHGAGRLGVCSWSSEPVQLSGLSPSWEALQDRRRAIREAKLPFGERQHAKLAKAHAQGHLIETLGQAMEKYKRPSDDHNLKGMARALKNGFEVWEQVLITPGEPWSPYVSAEARRGARKSIADAEEFIPFL